MLGLLQFLPCDVSAFLTDPFKLGLTIASLFFATIAFFEIRRASPRYRALYAYAHLAFLFFPFVFFLVQMTCQQMVSVCGFTDMAGLVVFYSIPVTIVLAVLVGLVAVPLFYTSGSNAREVKSGKFYSFIKRESKEMGMPAPRLFVVDEAKPLAFSLSTFKPSVMVSVGLLDVMSQREIEAVLLHELYHVKKGSPAFKFAATLLQLFSPFAARGFGNELGREEELADQHAYTRQRTSRFLESARQKTSARVVE